MLPQSQVKAINRYQFSYSSLQNYTIKMMDNEKHEQSLGEFQQFTQQYMTYTASSQLVVDHNSSNRKIGSASKVEKPKLKIINEPVDKNQKGGIQSLLNANKKYRKLTSPNSKIIAIGDAIFRSNFESGNIENVQKIAPSTFQVTLAKQLNSERISAWFYFAVEGLKGQSKFIIKGFTKTSSLYNDGMKICYKEVQQGKWRRGGTKILYTESYYDDQQPKQGYELHFSFFFKSNQPNAVEFAYCFPYTYTNLIKFISLSQTKISYQTLGKTFQGRQIPFLTIGNTRSKYVIIVSARAHPGQTVGSLIMEGFLKELISDNDYSRCLRQSFLFKIVPMINPDGVVNGNYRFSGSGFDLNRKWKSCTTKMHPQIYLFRQKIKQISKQKQIIMFIDLHGHSRQKNVFFYGCCPKGQSEDDGPANTKPKQFPFLMSKLHPAFRYDYCCYTMQKQKQGTARIAMWNQLKIDNIFTLQASLCGTDITNFLVADYEKVGEKLCHGMCLHFLHIIKQKNSDECKIENQTQNKMNQELKKTMNEFFQNPQIAQIQFEGNSSDSEPEAGEIPESQRQKKKEKSVISIQKLYKASRISKFTEKTFLEQDLNNTFKTKKSFTQKMQPHSRNKTNQSIRLVNGIIEPQYIIQSKSEIKNLSTDMAMKTQNQFYLKADMLNKTINERIKHQSQKHSQSMEKNNRIISEPFLLKNQNQDFVQKNDLDKNQKKAVSFEGAQYRRVRKLAEEHNRRHYSAQHPVTQKQDETLIRGLVGMNNLLQIQRAGSRQRAPSFFPNTSHYSNNKSRKGTAQLHFRRQIRASDYTSRRLYVNGLEQEVRCLGKQII